MKKGYFFLSVLCLAVFAVTTAADPDGPGRILPGSHRPQINTHNAPGPYTIAMTTRYIEGEMVKNNAVGLSIALVNADGVVWEKGFGWADREEEIAATKDSVYMIGSVTKLMTAVNLVRLHELGIVDLDRPAVDYIPEFRMADRYPGTLNQITVRRLLNHHSGIPGDIYHAGFLEGDLWEDRDLYMNWLLDYLETDYPTLPPGTLGVYCNTGFVLAGEIALRADGLAGETYPDYLDRVLLSPLGMTHSSLYTVHENLARGYAGGEKQPFRQTNGTFGATGGVYATVGDMGRFLAMILNRGTGLDGRSYLKPETVNLLGEAETTNLDIDTLFIPGLGLDTVKDPGLRFAGRAWGKSGGTGDYVAYTALLPDQKLAAVVLTNSDTGSNLAWGAVRACLKNALFEVYGVLPSPAKLPSYTSVENPDIIAGTYVKKFGYDVVTNNGDGTLTWQINAHTGTPETCILYFNGTTYNSPLRTESLSFATLTQGGTDHFVMIQSGSSGSDNDAYIYQGNVRILEGEKIEFPPIPEAWSQRLGIYILDDLPWDDTVWSQPFAILTSQDGHLVFNYENTLYPENDDLAFTAGINNRSDSSLRIIEHDGMEKMLFGGHRFYAIDRVPAIVSGQTVSGTLEGFDSDWYRFDAQEDGQTVTLAAQSDHYLSVFDGTFTQVARQKGALSWTATGGETYFVAVTPGPDADPAYTLILNTLGF